MSCACVMYVTAITHSTYPHHKQRRIAKINARTNPTDSDKAIAIITPSLSPAAMYIVVKYYVQNYSTIYNYTIHALCDLHFPVVTVTEAFLLPSIVVPS